MSLGCDQQKVEARLDLTVVTVVALLMDAEPHHPSEVMTGDLTELTKRAKASLR